MPFGPSRGYIVLAYIVMAYFVMTYIVMAYTVVMVYTVRGIAWPMPVCLCLYFRAQAVPQPLGDVQPDGQGARRAYDRVCYRAVVQASERACVHACVHACMRACVLS